MSPRSLAEGAVPPFDPARTPPVLGLCPASAAAITSSCVVCDADLTMTDRPIPSAPADDGPAMMVSVDGDAPIAWAEFCSANADAFDAGELAVIAADVRRDGVYVAGGGALPDFEIRLAALTVEMA